MRIIGGKYRGRVLFGFDGLDVRPTSDRARESLFNILGAKIQGKSFLDLFCGTGAIGIEALSRGAGKVTFNDNSKKSLALAEGNLKKIKADEDYVLSFQDAVRFIKTTEDKFDYVFIDPPYKSEVKDEILKIVGRVLTDDGIVIAEREDQLGQVDADGLQLFDERKYGRARFYFFRKND